MAGKKYKIEFMEISKTYEGKELIVENGQQQFVDKTFTYREQEIALLSILHNNCEVKERAVLLRYLDTAARYDNIDKEKFIEIDEEELGWLQKGLDEAMKKKQPYWMRCRNLIRQIDNPEEVKGKENVGTDK